MDNGPSFPNRIDVTGQTFIVVFCVSVEELEEGRIGQVKGRAIDIGKIYAVTRNGYWFSEPFIIPGGAKIPSEETWFSKIKKG